MSTPRSKKNQPADPHSEREAQKYENPIPSREFIMQHMSEAGVPLKLSALISLLHIDKEQITALKRRVRAMERDGQIVRNRRGGYGLPARMDMLHGRVIAHPDGYGFVVIEEGGDDVFLAEKQMRSVMHGDRVLVSIIGTDRKGRREGMLVEVLERNTEEVVGRFFRERRLAFVEPNNRRLNKDIIIPPGEQNKAENGQIVVVQLLEQPDKHYPPVGRIVKVLGDHMAAGMETDIAMRDHNLPNRWPREVLKEIEPLTDTIPASAKQGREDIRDLPLVTIDGEDSRDFDDAVYCEPKGKGWRLLVAIADVSAYVKPGTALDEEAKNRATSVYFPDRVLPMLPEILSNGLCSLNPGVERLCMVCEMIITHHGTVRKARFFEGLMQSSARLTYNQVAAVIGGDRRAVKKKVLPQVDNLYALFQLLRARRQKRGAIDFDTTETRIIFGENRKIDSIVPTVRTEAHMLIEEMMLAANVATAEFLSAEEMPFLYRVHEGPTEEKLAALRDFLKEMGLQLHGRDKPHAKHYAKLLDSIGERSDRHLIQTVLLRSLRMAVYSPDNQGHFGLAFDAYAHFTSPIRRYPDLLVHRAIKHRLKNLAPEKFRYSHADMQLLGEHCSSAERRADEATRDAMDWLKCEYMQDKVGETYSGLVTAVTGFGLFVELEGIFVEGLIHVTALKNDYYHFDPVGHRLYGERSGNVYRLADKIQVKVARVDLDEKKIDFLLAD